VTSNDDYVLQLLQEQGYVSPEQVGAVMNSIKQEGETTLDILMQIGAVTEDDVLAMIAAQFGMEYVHVNADGIDPAVKEVIPSDVARKYGVVPVYRTEDSVTVALSDPMGYDTVDSLRYVLKMNVDAVVAPRAEVKAAVDKLYPEDFENIYGAMSDEEIDVAEKEKVSGSSDAKDSDAPVIRLVSMIITEACKMRASDIHLEPMERHFRVRYRIDGVLRQMENPPKRLQAAILSRVKIMSNMKISEKRIPQDGRIQVKVQGRDLDLRVSSVPTNHGESIVMRILDKSNLSLGLPQLGFLSDDQNKFERLISLPDGVLLVTGPTGSGKTTTLYACLGQINLPDRKIITVEDPVEYQMSGINQVQVNKDVGLDFSAALRSILRQAPNIVMIGEIRDHETADIAMEAALTGHLVFSTLHTNDAPSAVTRLLDIGVKPFLVASALRAAMAQRLVRAICDSAARNMCRRTAN
jgi:general secretion pathway protein E/type IV pilus assembly protein PilB